MTRTRATEWVCGGKTLSFAKRPLIMGILNLTPDSFSDGGRFLDPEAALTRGLALLDAGADLLDLGAESTRPGAEPVSAEEECRRLLPVLQALANARPDATLSVDTTKAAVAQAALAAGAAVINDISACTQDPAMPAVVSGADCGVVLMHMRGTPDTMQAAPCYADVVSEVRDHLRERARAMIAAGIHPARIALDPGIGFGKTPAHNLALLAGLNSLTALGHPVLIGLSRKSFLGTLTGRPVEQRLAASLAGLAFSVLRGAGIVRVHDVAETFDVVQVLAALRQAEQEHAA